MTKKVTFKTGDETLNETIRKVVRHYWDTQGKVMQNMVVAKVMALICDENLPEPVTNMCSYYIWHFTKLEMNAINKAETSDEQMEFTGGGFNEKGLREAYTVKRSNQLVMIGYDELTLNEWLLKMSKMDNDMAVMSKHRGAMALYIKGKFGYAA